MKYADGEEVRLGDRVRFDQGEEGVVVFSIDTQEYSQEFPEAQWGYLKKGVMVAFPSCGLVHYEQSAPDLQLIARVSK